MNCSRVRKLLSVFIILLMMVNLVSCSTSKTSGFIVLNDYVKFDTTRNRRMVLNVLSNASNPDVSIASIDGDGIENAEYKWSFDNEPIAKYESYSAYMLLLDFDIDEGCVVSIKSIELTLNGTKKTVTFANPVIFRSRVGSLDEKVAEVLEINPVAFAMHSDKVGELHVQTAFLLGQETPKPFFCFSFGVKAAFCGFTELPCPVLVSVLDQPLPGLGVLLCFQPALTSAFSP